MPGQHRSWRELAELASKERDSQRLATLVDELNAALETEELLRRAPVRRALRILFVDDEPSIRATLPVVLRNKGFQVDVAGSIPEALGMLRPSTFDVLLSDLNVGQPQDGFALTRTMRQVDPQCVTIILTGYAELDSAMRAVQRVDGYLAKPTDIDSLVDTIQRLVSERAQAESR